MSSRTSIDTTKLDYILRELPVYLAEVSAGIASEYLKVVDDQFVNNPSYWKPLHFKTVAYKEGLRKAGEPVAFKSPGDILVNYGLLRQSISVRPGKFIQAAGGLLPITHRVGVFRGNVAGKGRLKWAWQHEFGTSYLIGALKWKRKAAQGLFKGLRSKEIISVFRSLKPLKIGKADIEGKMNIEKFINAVRKLARRLRVKLKIEKQFKQKYVNIPKRSILRTALNLYAPTFAAGVSQALKVFMQYVNAIPSNPRRKTI